MPALNLLPKGRAYLLWVGLLGLVMLYFAMLMMSALSIERKLGQQVDRMIAESGLTRVESELRGRDVVLHGLVSSDEMAAEISRRVEAIQGVRTVDEKLAVEVWKLPWLRLQENPAGNRIISGRLPLPALRDQVMQMLSGAGIEAENRVRVDPEVAMPGWMGLIPQLLESRDGLERFSVEIGAGKLTVSGRVYSAGRVEFYLGTLEELAEPFGLGLVNRIALVSQ